MRLIIISLLLALLAVSADAAEVRTKLVGPLEQGALVVGYVEKDAQVFLHGEAVRTYFLNDKQDIFYLGFDRDAEATAPLEVHYKDGAKESRELAIAPHDYDIQKLSLPETMVTPPKDVLARIDSDKMAIRKARAKISEPCNFFGTFSRPAEGIISGTYGSQRILNGKPKNPHMGMDIAGKVGTPVKAPLAGTVSLIRDMYYTGNTVLIDHGCGVQTVYAHLSKVLVNTGRHVEQGELIGQIGKTGRATGPHLHWGLSLEGQQLNPQPYLK